MPPKLLDAIRRRAATPQRADEVVTEEHAVCSNDRRALLEYVDALTAEISDIAPRLESVLGASRIMLGIKLLEDGHAKTLGAAIELAEDIDRVRELYPVPE